MPTTQQASPIQGASAQAIQQHYDLSNEFYALWLDETLTYSCALWDYIPGDTLELAQLRKLDYLATGAKAPGAARVLDVGCGWGGMLDRLVDTHRVGHVVGLTLAEQQAEWVRAKGLPRRQVLVESWAEHQPDEPYDAIVSIGAFEHFARHGLPRAQRVDSYREFFARAHSWLRPGGRIALQTNIKGNNVRMDRQTVRDLLFIIENIFTESEIPWFSEVIEASERLFEVISVRNDPDHYARTCQAWHDGLRAHQAEAVALVGEQRYADYDRYLGATVGHFARRHLGLLRLVLEAV